eukprot:8244874-Karenia_brevis.AAC.1
MDGNDVKWVDFSLPVLPRFDGQDFTCTPGSAGTLGLNNYRNSDSSLIGVGIPTDRPLQSATLSSKIQEVPGF